MLFTDAPEAKFVAATQTRAMQAEMARRFNRDQFYVISVGLMGDKGGGVLWFSPDYAMFDEWMLKNSPGWRK
jgi:hypothetical protein